MNRVNKPVARFLFGTVMNFNFTQLGRRPTVRQIIKRWRDAGKPQQFTAEYGETFAEFEKQGTRWEAFGNGQRGIERDSVVQALNADATT